MPDINEWRLEYGFTSYDFGSMETSDVPLRVQVDVSDADRATQDSSHPNSDGRVMGIERLGGMTLTFDCQIVPEPSAPGERWDRPLDLFTEFKSVWRADWLRRQPGSYATLTNLERGKVVYGRPRKCAPKFARIRKREANWLADFYTVDPNFYAADSKVIAISTAGIVTAGLVAPLTPPFNVVGAGTVVDDSINDGDVASWPVIQLVGPGTQSIELLVGPTVIWKLTIASALKAGQTLRIDTRPWARGATLNGAPANGILRGSQLEDCTIPVGDFSFRYRSNDLTGVANANIEFRDAYASL